ncbi:DUF3093 domain-containing protein [Cryobacterium psychrophilum]|uniref:DUF3093 domain-containing protein n=1 Tax=Cryobacterium psychrophilum TaxID=41988 RepID=A0A4Y8KNL0_9MICO|nr:DUF3093 domain-containing protein [Cryobacterium psychrophilum]TDW31386.1 hypothetical protein EDD25_3195 [Cryobacterium psychrophilum]TFD78831.1 DUF3093 domain-containing protein [Cryobacterium psychrophilum]
MPQYREKLWASAWSFIVTALVIPASILVLAPINMEAGFITAAVLYGGCVTLLVIASPVVRVENGLITAGPATISVDLVGEVTAFSGPEARQERGPRLDVRAWMLIRGWVDPVVRIPIVDETDPAPYWLVSSRHPEKLAAAINESRRPAVGS